MGKPEITFDEFQKMELKAARVLAAERVPETAKLVTMEIDMGSERRQIVAGIADVYEPQELVGRDIILVANLQPAKIRGALSQGMLLAASIGGQAILACFDKPVPPGTDVV